MVSTQDRLKNQPPFSEKETEPEPKEEVKEEPVVEEEVEEEVTEEEALENSKNPERTGEYIEKLKEENKELKKNVLDSLRPEPVVSTEPPPSQLVQEFTPEMSTTVEKHTTELNPDAVDDIYANLIDENGYIDAELLKSTLKGANEEAKRARQEAEAAKKSATEAIQNSDRKFRDFEEDQQVRKVHKKYPQIDPKNDDFNELFWDDVRKEIATAPILKGENIDFMDAADKIWNERYAEEVEPVKNKDKVAMDKKVDQKKNINASVPSGHFEGYYSETDTKELNEATRQRKKGALAERLKRSGY